MFVNAKMIRNQKGNDELFASDIHSPSHTKQVK